MSASWISVSAVPFVNTSVSAWRRIGQPFSWS
jgi:hypothetical protein